MLLAVAALEVAINRIAVPMMRPDAGKPPGWHTVLDYGGLFLFYFTGVLATLKIAMYCAPAVRRVRSANDWIAHALAAAAGVLAAIPLVISSPRGLSLPLEIAFGAAVIALAGNAIAKQRDLGIQIGLPVLAIPLLLHTASALGTALIWTDELEGPGVNLGRIGVIALASCALVSPYCFAPRPFARAVTQPFPIAVTTVFAGAGAVLARTYYQPVAEAASAGLGVAIDPSNADPRIAMYLLALATLVWTLSSCAVSASPARRLAGAGLALIILGGYGFRWPHHYLLPLLGFVLIGDAVRRVRDEELAALPITSETPPVPDAAWAAYVTSVVATLKRSLTTVHQLTTRGDAGMTSSVIVGDAEGLTVRAKVERIDGCVLALDVVVGREIDELRSATLTLWAIAPRALGINPSGPPAAPGFKAGDPSFDDRFKVRGSTAAFSHMFDDELRARSVATLDGWLAYWEHEGVRYRVYPGRGSPLDHPMPLSDLALGRPVSPERLVSVIELLIELARRGVRPTPAAPVAPTEPSELEVG